MYSRILKFTVALFLCVGLMSGCDDSSDRPDKPALQFSYSVLTSASGSGVDLLEELNSTVLPRLKKAGGREYAIWRRASDSSNDFEEIAEDKLVVMLRWRNVNTQLLAEKLEAMTGVSGVTTTLWNVCLRGGEGPIETGAGFYIHRSNRYLSADVDHVLSLNEQAWVTWEPFWEAEAVGVWCNLDEVDQSNGVTQLMRIAWYRDMEHWQETREFWLEPNSLEIFIERLSIELDDESLSGNLQPH